MLNACLRCSTLSAGLFSLIQGVVWAGVCIWGISIYEGTATYPFQNTVTIDNEHFVSVSYIFYIAYLRGVNGPVSDSCPVKDFSYVAPSAGRTYRFLMAYSIISSIWIPTAAMLIAGTCLGARGTKAKWIYIPWLIVSAANCILDLVAIGYYSQDITKSYASGDYRIFLDLTELDEKCLNFHISSGALGYDIMVPGIIMTVAASRFIFLWLLNFFFFIFGLQGICAFTKKKKPQPPIPYHLSQEYNGITKEQNYKNPNEPQQWIDFRRPEPPVTNNSQFQAQANFRNRLSQGQTNLAFVGDQPIRLDPVVVEVKQEKNNLKEVRYAEVESIEIELTPEEIHPTIKEINNVAAQDLNSHISVAESALSADDEEEEDEINEIPSQESSHDSNNSAANLPRRIYDAYGNPTEERLTPRVKRIQKIIENQMANQRDASGGYNVKPFSYTQPQMPQVDSIPKKNDTVRGLDKPPIPVPDYSIRVTKKPSLRTPLPNAENVNSTD